MRTEALEVKRSTLSGVLIVHRCNMCYCWSGPTTLSRVFLRFLWLSNRFLDLVAVSVILYQSSGNTYEILGRSDSIVVENGIFGDVFLLPCN